MKDKIQLTTPVGYLMYPYLQAPSYGTDLYPDPNGSFKVDLILDSTDKQVKAFLKEFKTSQESLSTKKVKSHIKEVDTVIEGLDSSKKYFKLQPKKRYQYVKDGEEQYNKLPIFDVNGGVPFIAEDRIANLSTGQLRLSLKASDKSPYGCFFNLDAVMIHNFIPYSSGTADSYGFEYTEAEEEDDVVEVSSTVIVDSEAEDFDF